MRKSAKLSLKREALSPLTSEEMTSVAGGSHACQITDDCTHASIDQSCYTVPPTQCVVTTIFTTR